MKLFFINILIICGSVSSCYYHSEEELYGKEPCITTNVSFAQDINPILINHCLSCHFDGSVLGGGIILEGYIAVMPYVQSKALVGAIKHEGFAAMPKDQPKLDDCKISLIEAWVKAGAPDN